MDQFQEMIGKVMAFDALATAEEITGKPIDDQTTAALGTSLHIRKGQELKKRLIENRDVYFYQPLNEYIKTLIDIGFVNIYTEDFVSIHPGFDKKETQEHLYCFWNPDDAILLCFDTCTIVNQNVNGGDFYYNWKPKDKDFPRQMLSSGRWNEGIWVGHHDSREGVRYIIETMKEYGAFINPWIERPFNWISHHMEHSGDENKSLTMKFQLIRHRTEERIQRFPEEVRKVIPFRKDGE